MRFPDVVLHALLTLLIYDIGRMFKNERTGFMAALIFTFLNFPLELISGNIELDHNDISFLFYVTASFWCLFKYRERGKFKWVYFIGIFSGCAILVKWLPGLLVYLSWGIIYLSEDFRQKTFFKNLKPLFTAFLVTLIIFLPWQIYCYFTYPAEFKYEMFYNGLHLTHAVEGHEGDWTFHFSSLSRLYGEGVIVPVLLLAAFLFVFFDKKVSPDKKIISVAAVVFVYLFYSLVQTKMIAFPLTVLPFVLVLLSNFLNMLLDFLRNKIAWASAFGVLCLASGFLFLDLNRFLKSHTLFYKPEENNERHKDILEAAAMRNLNKMINEHTVVFNARDLDLRIMFYTHAVAYAFIPTENDCKLVKEKNYKVAVLDRGNLPAYIKDDPSIIKIPFSN